jgi:anthranilate synthase component 1
MKPQLNLSEEEFITKAKAGEKIISNFTCLLSDLDTPVSTYAKLSQHFKDCFLFESVLGGEKLGRYSFIGANALNKFSSFKTDDFSPYDEIENLLSNYSYKNQSLNIQDTVTHNISQELKFFHKGFVGFFSFESIQRIEPSLDLKESPLPEYFLYLAGSLIVFDHVGQKLYIISNSLIESLEADYLKNVYQKSTDNINQLITIISEKHHLEKINDTASKNTKEPEISKFKSNSSEKAFKDMVRKAQEHILEGDIFQVVLSQRFFLEAELDALSTYRLLRSLNPSPYLYLFNVDLSHLDKESFSIVGSSPEMLIKSEIIKNENGESEIWAELRPIAGTYKRGENASEDKILIEELLKDTKEIAEHVMLVDLGRNDLGRVCENGTIHLAENMVVEKYSHVLHIVSSVKGKLKKDISSIALLKACFPAGTLTGAPKVEAIKIISKLENEARGPYGGCLGYINLDGTINVAIVIRTIILEKHQASIQCGAGIVADSSPESEYQETFNKARALMEVLSTLA